MSTDCPGEKNVYRVTARTVPSAGPLSPPEAGPAPSALTVPIAVWCAGALTSTAGPLTAVGPLAAYVPALLYLVVTPVA